jgi:23S rRNA (cytosine1962-C5)-methyltransferase
MPHSYPKIILHKGKDHSLKRFHPWVFSGAIKKVEGDPIDGSIVDVFSFDSIFIGVGIYQEGTITVRILSFQQERIDLNFWSKKLQDAYNYRTDIGITTNKNSNVYRLAHAEGDSVPSLIIDYYDGTAVIQAYSVGIYNQLENITEALKIVYGSKLKAVYNKSSETLSKKHSETNSDGYLLGSGAYNQVVENDNKFLIDWEKGQKSGFFIDQRENRLLLGNYSNGKKVLNTFCYTGGFSIYALNAGATLVHSVDISKTAVEITDKNVELNGKSNNHQSFAVDVFDFLKNMPEEYDIIVLDPPAFAKSRKVSHNAVQGYKRINYEAIKRIKKGGLIFTFSCSQVISRTLFTNTITAAAIEAKRKVKIIHQLSQAPCHPVNIFHPEGEYLKGLVLFVE